MTFDETIAHFGSRNALADRLGVSVAAIAMWKYRTGGIPLSVQWQIELGTKGKLKADEPPFLHGLK